MVNKIMNLKIQKRLLVSSIISSVITVLATILAVVVIFYSKGRYDKVLTYYAFPQGDIGHAMAALSDMRSATRGAIGYEEQEMIDRMVEQHEESRQKLDTYMKLINASIVTEQGKKDIALINQTLEAYFEIDTKVLELGSTTDTERSKQAQDLAWSDMAPAYEAAYSALQELMETNVALGDETQSTLNVLIQVLIIAVILIVALAIFVSTKMSMHITKSIVNPINELDERMLTFAQGDIASPFPKHDVADEVADMMESVGGTAKKLARIFADLEELLGQMSDGNFDIRTSCEEEYVGEYRELLVSIRQMNSQVSRALEDVKGAASTVNSGAANLAEASQHLAEGATDEAAAVEEMQATINEITIGLENTMKEVGASYEKAEECAAEAEQSRIQMEAMMEAMNRISETSLKIGDIIAELEDIASQTNLLSLNASIEAARAGDAGRGFAVVADQIRNLAEQSAKSAVNTRELIEGSIQEVEAGNQAAKKTSDVLSNVVVSIKEIAKTSKMINEMSQRQAEAMEQADSGVEKISEVVQATSATAEEVSATSEELSAQSMSMDELVGKFTLRRN